ncbi:Uncharacterized protein Adt_04587 [Abeliophyllum distichum]|uniref:Uncharacterized protein n=1 Tax=Abeliophyllum distichum TaxID=126358 RepID=A0ABD1V1P1_9LAMI
MVNNRWLLAGFFAEASFLPRRCYSDHLPCVVSILHQLEAHRKHFKLFNMWTTYTDFNELLHTSWVQGIDGTKQFSLCKKLKRSSPLKCSTKDIMLTFQSDQKMQEMLLCRLKYSFMISPIARSFSLRLHD